jgi:hypothetical protein
MSCDQFHQFPELMVSPPFFLKNQADALIIPVLFCYKTLQVSGIFCAHHQEFSIVHSALVIFMQVSEDRFQYVAMKNNFNTNFKFFSTFLI